MPLGIFCDRIIKNALFASLGCIILILAILGIIHDMNVILAAEIAGFGNALFHMGGGIDVLNAAKNKSGPVGIFVAPGSFGLFAGYAFGSSEYFSYHHLIILLAACAIVIAAFQLLAFRSLNSQNLPLSFKLNTSLTKSLALAASTALFIVVAIRSYVGMTLTFDWKYEWHWALILCLVTVAGNILGGLLSDRFGIRKTACFTLIPATIFFLFPNHPIIGVLAVLCFNMTMPMTLWSLSEIFHHAKGFAFGTLTCALFVGVVLNLIFPDPLAAMGPEFAALTLMSLILLWFGIKALPASENKQAVQK